MSTKTFIAPKIATPEYIKPKDGALLEYIKRYGKVPGISLSIFALEDLSTERKFDHFISYKFSSSVLVPVDSFSCEVYYKKLSGFRKPREGDIFVLRANNIPIATGIVDQLDMDTEASGGTKLSITGRDLLGQWEDQDSVSADSKIIYGNKYTVSQIVRALAQNTRINPDRLVQRNGPKQPYLAASQPGESKLSTMQRFCEALDIYFWTLGDGTLVVGRPGMYGPRMGRYFCKSSSRESNVLAMRSTRASTQIPNILLPIWNGQENVQSILAIPQSVLINDAEGPARLLKYSHRTPKAIVVSTPEGSSPQDLADIDALLVAKQNVEFITNEDGKQVPKAPLTRAGASTILQAYAKREMARANLKELKVQVNVPGHYNDRAEPLQVDQVYRIQYEEDDIDEDMYLYEVEHTLDDKGGPQSKLFFCRQKALVSSVRAL